MTLNEVLALAPALSPVAVLLVFIYIQSKKDDNTLSVAWVGVAPELFKGFREDLQLARQEADEANRRATEAREASLHLAEEFYRYRIGQELYALELTSLLRENGIAVPDRKDFTDNPITDKEQS